MPAIVDHLVNQRLLIHIDNSVPEKSSYKSLEVRINPAINPAIVVNPYKSSYKSCKPYKLVAPSPYKSSSTTIFDACLAGPVCPPPSGSPSSGPRLKSTGASALRAVLLCVGMVDLYGFFGKSFRDFYRDL